MILLILGCTEFFAIRFAPTRVPEISEAPDAIAARDAFWDAFETDRVDQLPQVVETLTAAYLAHPTDPSLARLLGHTHFWWFVERKRTGSLPASATDHAVLSEHYFEQAAELDPDDHRIHAWWGGSQLVVGGIRADEVTQRRGYFETRRGLDSYPAFNLVTAAFSFSVPPRDSPAFPAAVDSMWRAVEQCAGGPVDRMHFDPTPILTRDPLPPRDQGETCWNKERFYPYSQQGIFLQLGDILMKDEQPQAARSVYEAILATPDFDAWPAREMLRARLEGLDRDAEAWRAYNRGDTDEEPPFLVNSGRSCTVCHARVAHVPEPVP